MATESSPFKKNSMRDLGLSVLILVVAVIIVLRYSTVTVKMVGHALLLIPDAVGFVERVGGEQVRSFSTLENRNTLDLPEAGAYLMYTNDENLQTMAQGRGRMWLNITPIETDNSFKPVWVERGLRPYDTLQAPGRPIMRFVVNQPGNYTFSHLGSTLKGTLTVVPDYTTGYERTMYLSIFAQFAIFALVFGLPRYRHYRTQQAIRKALQAEKRQEIDEFMERALNNNNS